MAALKAFHVSDAPNLEKASLSLYSTRFSNGVELNRATSCRIPNFLLIGHRGHGMNILQSSDSRMKAIKENSLLSFNSAAKFPLDFIEFDVQVTKDDCPVIFHDDVILSEENGTVFEKRVTELCLAEFLCYGPQKEAGKEGKCLYRKTKDGKFEKWNVETDDSLCTLQEAFVKVEPSLGFNIELKFDDYKVYQQDHLTRILQVILQVVFEFARDRPIIFSTFQPDAAQLVRKLQNNYPVHFLTEGGTKTYYDVRRNSLEEAMKVCLEGSLQGIVSEIKGVFKDPGAVSKIKRSNLSLLTYGKLNNVPEAVYMQYLMGIDGVIFDFVEEISRTVVDSMIKPDEAIIGEESLSEANSKLEFTEKELSFLLKLIPELIQQHKSCP
ncbi:Glycerophosphodiester phosphodiesterase GDPD1 [Hibiscus syriacus]|uniref:glycerophosphodiester phosphodiesterase n=1 Tax=Hibiscus syriacus TaxID=106335 RepID=A0A6A3BGM4_HIBSY|nr:glycerophosphodiester phosphodiesterase GDPD2-like [Hibiscus syriacus]KAE8715874.1 Glycerophosphodiester phosphodiesterase GDPD1 [Hibiscus syriacus]